MNLIGLVDPEICKIIKCKNTITTIIKCKMKSNKKNGFKVELLIENPPQMHSTVIWPI